MTTKSIGGGFKIRKDANGKTVVEKDRKAQLAKLDVSKRLQVEKAAGNRIRYGKKGAR